jgi:hypothetical protein
MGHPLFVVFKETKGWATRPIASLVIDATAIGICASDYQGWLPHF